MKSSLEGTNSPAEWGEERTNKLKDRSVEIIQFEEQRENNEEKQTKPQRLGHEHYTSICKVGVPKGNEGEGQKG